MNKTEQGSGIAPGGGQLYIFQSAFPQSGTINGVLTGFRNPNPYSLLIKGGSEVVTLSAGQKTTPANIQSLYDSASPSLPVNIKFIPDVSANNLGSVEVEVDYTIK